MNLTNESGILQGRVQFPTGGKAREPKGMIRWDSGADSKVWMEEDASYAVLDKNTDTFDTLLWDGEIRFRAFLFLGM